MLSPCLCLFLLINLQDNTFQTYLCFASLLLVKKNLEMLSCLTFVLFHVSWEYIISVQVVFTSFHVIPKIAHCKVLWHVIKDENIFLSFFHKKKKMYNVFL